MNICALLVAHPQAAKLIQPGEGSFYHPTTSAQPAAMCGISLRQPRRDVARTETPTDCFSVITSVA